ncbi:MAG: rhodanese-like domain-containing protein [Spirochaetales bacterium]|uniref:Rhodanese-like domain-containing protein n=1 Tax=Candidatus Thalassospirochaeta sargassi TaxID=3119039 RepID=A0AAJ1MNF9_9SPIO|nr:rhodanese-like domain-containing protein [Spirochaetales bacterium]
MKTLKILNIVILSFVLIFSVSAGGTAEVENSSISGTIEGGLRILDIEDGEGDLEYTIYRGDYIVFRLEDGSKYEFEVPGLEINEVLPKAAEETSYVKMKKSGDYEFTLGERQGVFHVLELVDANYQELTAYDANRLIQNVNPLIIDVRTEGEYRQGHIPGADLLPVQVFAENISKLEEYKDEDILLYCASGNRSTVAARMLIDAGFTKVYNLRSGIGDWMRNNLPVE